MAKALDPLRATIRSDLANQIKLYERHPERHAVIKWDEAKALEAQSRDFAARLLMWLISGNMVALLLAAQALINKDTPTAFHLPLIVALWLFLIGVMGAAIFAYFYGAYLNAEASLAAYAAMLQEKLRDRSEPAENRLVEEMVLMSVGRSVGMLVSSLCFILGLSAPLLLITLQGV